MTSIAGVDVAAAQHDHRRCGRGSVSGYSSERGEPGRARAFEDRLLDLGAERDRLFDALLGDDDDVVDERRRRCSRVSVPRSVDGDAFGDRRAAGCGAGPRPSACTIPA